MSKIGESILQGATEALEYAKGNKRSAKTHKVYVPKHVDVRAIREKLHMTRGEFADCYGFALRTLEKWEQGVRQPEGAARAYLCVIAHSPKTVESALRKSEE
ncbi:MAG: transcriptional regulator [Proteobacteria bacterium]|nr:transcriptional regulator [Pseudomonadota bacterium]